jgi:glycosyltransferase involved in cell wall biosynthesis
VLTDVSIIIPSYNSYKTIGHTVKSILRQSRLDCIREVIIVDSSDDERTRDLLQSLTGPKIILITLSQKTIPSLGRNLGAFKAKAQLLCFIDSDVCLAQNWLEEILAAYENGCRIGCGSVSIPEFQERGVLANAQLYLQFNEYLDTGKSIVKDFVPSCDLFCDRDVFNKAEGFPDLRASEDVMFCLKLKGVEKVWFIPSARCYHIFREEWKGFLNNQVLLGQYVSVYRRLYHKSWMYQGMTVVILLPGFLVVKFLKMIGRIKSAGKNHLAEFIKVSPVFLIGLVYWAGGFIKGCFTKNENS